MAGGSRSKGSKVEEEPPQGLCSAGEPRSKVQELQESKEALRSKVQELQEPKEALLRSTGGSRKLQQLRGQAEGAEGLGTSWGGSAGGQLEDWGHTLTGGILAGHQPVGQSRAPPGAVESLLLGLH